MLQTIIALLAWYAFNGAFNVENKRVLSAFDFPWLASWVQLATGMLIVVPVWMLGLRRVPKVDRSVLMQFAPMAMLHAAGHALQVAGIGAGENTDSSHIHDPSPAQHSRLPSDPPHAGSVYFGTVIKATEPLIGTLIAFAFTGKISPWYVNLTFLPIVGGVAYAAAKPGASTDLSDLRSFAALAALTSTVFFALAKLLAKRIMTREMKEQRGLDAANTYSVLTCGAWSRSHGTLPHTTTPPPHHHTTTQCGAWSRSALLARPPSPPT